jgi:tripartite-type tricarboxylate transporter receptor subunit TctC
MVLLSNRVTQLIYCGCFSLLVLFSAGQDACGEQKPYPGRAIKVMVGTAPGGVPDLWSRAWTDEFSKALKVPVIIANVAGASTMGALIEAAKAKPDGYTLTTASQSNVVGYSIAAKPVVDVFKDFTPIGAFGSFPTIIAVESSSPFKTYEDLVDFARKNPNKLKCGTAGATIISTFIFELLKQQANIDVVMVPFKGSPPSVNALLGKHVDLLTLSPSALMGLMKAGRVRALLTTRKMKELPDVPLFSEKGLTEAAMSSWMGIFAPSGIPKEIEKKLVDTFATVVKDPKVVKRMEDLGFNTYYQNPPELTSQMKKDSEKLRAVAKRAGISE